MTGSLLEVWGDPIAHSLSPALHAAAYAELGWDWTYGRRRVDDAAFATELASLGTQYRGLSLTFPLKGVAYAASAERDLPAELTGAVNTLLLTEAGPRGFNTDVGWIPPTRCRASSASPKTPPWPRPRKPSACPAAPTPCR